MNMPQGLMNNKVAYDGSTKDANGNYVGTTGWIDASGIGAPMTLIVEGIVATDKIQVFVSNRWPMPGPTDVGTQLGADINANGITNIDRPFRWIRINRSVVDAGAVGVYAMLFGHRPAAV